MRLTAHPHRTTRYRYFLDRAHADVTLYGLYPGGRKADDTGSQVERSGARRHTPDAPWPTDGRPRARDRPYLHLRCMVTIGFRGCWHPLWRLLPPAYDVAREGGSHKLCGLSRPSGSIPASLVPIRCHAAV